MTTYTPNENMEVAAHSMPNDYRVQPYDVLNGRGKIAFNNVGNRRLRVTLSLALHHYETARNRQDKSKLIVSIIELVRNNGGHFLTRTNGRWRDIGDRAAREKIGHALRDMVSTHLAKKKKATEKERSYSPSCVVQLGYDEAQEPLDVFSTGVFPDQYIPDLCDALSNDNRVLTVEI